MKNKDWIHLIFFLSGASCLIYETVWLRILIRVLGNTVYATSIILAVFMAGLALGSYAIGRLSHKKQNLLRLYSYLELGIALSAAGLLFVFPHLVPIYRFFYHLSGDHRLVLTIVQSLIMLALLLVPTFLMGGTLPLLSSHTRRYEASFSDRIGALYGFNTLGAVVGVLGSGLIFIGLFGETRTIFIGVALNLFAAYIAYALSQAEIKAETPATGVSRQTSAAVISPYSDSTKKMILIMFALSGFAALAYEIIWMRVFQVYIGTSIYAFSLMLAFYLIGLGAGSLWGGRVIDRISDPLPWFGLAQLGIALYGILGLYLLTFIFQPGSPVLHLIELKSMFVISVVIVTPITFLFGLIFPAIAKSYVKDESDVSASVGQLYAFNTVGCILGSLVCGFILIAAFGTRGTIILLSGLNIFTALLAWAYQRKLIALASGFILTTLLLGYFAPDPPLHIINEWIKKEIPSAKINGMEFFLHKESAAVTTTAFGVNNLPQSKYLLVNGQLMTVPCLETKLMAHLPLLIHKDPKHLLVVCLGMGTTLRSALAHKDVKCDVVELVPEVYEYCKYFDRNDPQILSDPRVRAFVDDGRNFLLMHPYTYDVITVDPSPPIWSAGTVNLYSREFFALCKDHLNPGGVMCLWVPPVQYSEVRMVMRTFQAVFPNTYVWRGPNYPGFYLIGLEDRATLDLKRFAIENNNRDILADLNEWDAVSGLSGVNLLLSLQLASPDELTRFLKGIPVITDDLPYTEFPLWRSLFDKSFPHALDANSFAALKKQFSSFTSPSF
jgi:spermidine synthase